jgi:hypothetical protein
MILLKEVPVDLAAARHRLATVDYTPKEAADLSALYDAVEKGDFETACKMAAGMSRVFRELVACDVWDVLYDAAMGGRYHLKPEVPSSTNPAPSAR